MKLIASILLLSATAFAQSKSPILGHWQGEASSHDQAVPVYLDITGTPSNLKAALINGATNTRRPRPPLPMATSSSPSVTSPARWTRR